MLTFEPHLRRALLPLIPSMAGVRAHLVILREPYMGLVETGAKTVESRWGRVNCAPHHGLNEGDILIFQRAGGPIRGWTRASWVRRWNPHPEWGVAAILEEYGVAISVGPDYAAEVGDVRYATLIGLGPYHPLTAIPTGKRDGRGWVVLPVDIT